MEKQEKKKDADNKEAKKELSDAEKIEELTDSLQRLQAEFENYKKYTDKEKQEFMRFSKAQLIGTLLPVFDAFEMALTQTENKEKFVEGMNLIFDQLKLTLGNEGMRPIEAIGKPFDPFFHEVMMKKPSDKEADVIIDEVQKGYMIDDKVLRHSKVIVSQGPENEPTETDTNSDESKSESD